MARGWLVAGVCVAVVVAAVLYAQLGRGGGSKLVFSGPMRGHFKHKGASEMN